MAAINIDPLPIKSGLGLGFWVDLQEKLATAISTIEENTESEDSHDASSDSLEEVNHFDPDVHTVSEFLDAVTAIIAANSDVV